MKWLLILSSFFFLLAGVLLFAGQFLVVDDDLERADLCHVLSGNKERVLFGIELYERGLCDKLVFIGGKEGGDRSYASRQRTVAVSRGVPEADIVIDETDVFSTFDEITRLAEVIKTNSPSATVAHVTDPFHTRRVRMVSRWILGDSVQVRTVSVPFESSLFHRPWWEHRRSRKMIFREYSKMIFYWFRYRAPFHPLNNWLSRFDKIND